MKINYFRDLEHSYMIAQIAEAFSAPDRHAFRMLAENQIPGLLTGSIRYLDGQAWLYYTLDGTVSLEACYTLHKMTAEDLQRLLRDIRQLIRTLGEYLLDADGILFGREYIFLSVVTKRASFAYYPSCGENGSFSVFAEQLLDLVAADDEEAAALAYQLCALAQNRRLSFAEILDAVLQKADSPETPAESGPPGAAAFEEAAAIPCQDCDSPQPEDMEEETFDDPPARRAGFRFLWFVPFSLVFLALLYIRGAYILSPRESLLSLCGMAISLLSALASLLFALFGKSDSTKLPLAKQ